MGSYSYKEVCYSIPDEYIERFEKENHCTFDGDAGYNGDYWYVTAMYIADLKEKIRELESRLEPPCNE